MIQIILETQTGEKLPLTRDLGYVIKGIDGLSPQEATVNFSQSIRVYGRTHTGSSMSGRDITIQLYIEKEPEKARKAIYSIARPGEQLTVHIIDTDKHYKASGYVSTVDVGYFESLTTAQIAVQCESPYLSVDKTTRTIGSNTIKKFQFPIHTNENESFVFGCTQDTTRLVVKNNGEVETGAVFRLTVSQTVENPIIMDISSGMSMGIKGELKSNEILEISTESGKRKIHIIDRQTGAKTNILAKKSDIFDWLQVSTGENIFEVICKGSAKISLECSFTELALGV